MKKFNELVAKLNKSQDKLSLLLFADIAVADKVYENCYVPISYVKHCYRSYFENVIFFGEGFLPYNDNYYAGCSINTIMK